MKREEYNKAREDHYQDLDGNWKRFTVVDHDKKTSTARMGNKGKSKETIDKEKEEAANLKQELLDYNEQNIQAILAFSAIYAALPSDDFVQAHLFSEIITKGDTVEWDIPMLREICTIDREFTLKLLKRLEDHYEKK